LKFLRVRIMDISKWPLAKIMALPDWCFGQKWWVGTYIGTEAGAPTYFMIEESVPDKFVLWDVLVSTTGHTAATHANLTLRLCRQTPTAANIRIFRRLMTNLSIRTQFYDVHLPPIATTHLGPMKNLVEADNDRIGGALKLVLETATCENQVACLISGIPREVPDWVVSGLAGVR